VKEQKIKLKHAKSKEMMSVIQDTFRIYWGREFNSFETESYAVLFNIIRVLRQKALDKEILGKNPKLDPNEIELFNQLESRGDPDTRLYEEQVFEPNFSKYMKRT
jgi:hypothetical protein